MKTTEQWQQYIRERTKRDPATGCWEWQLGRNKAGYGDASAARRYGLSKLAHRLSYTVFTGALADTAQLRHQCHNPPCCNPAHLLPGTNQDNKNDSRRDGRCLGGTQVLDTQQIATIAQMLATGHYTQRKLAARFGTTQATISRIAKKTPSARDRGRSALSAEQTTALKQLLATGAYTQRVLAKQFGVSEATVSVTKTRSTA